MSTRTAIIRADGEGEAIWFNNDLFKEDNVAVSNQLTVLSRTLKKSVPPEIVKMARHAVWPRTVSIPASSIVPCPT